MVDEKKTEGKPAAQESANASAAAKSGKRRKTTMVVCIVAVALIALGGGFYVWHNQPTFCNAICHTPMDTYVTSYYNTDGTSLAATHMNAGKTCLSCHPAELGEQVTEGIHWITGDYVYDSENNQLASRASQFATQENCLSSGCHDMSLDELQEATSGMAWNPHNFTEHGVTACGSCHNMHGQSTIVCSECHYQAAENVPDGWASIPYREEK